MFAKIISLLSGLLSAISTFLSMIQEKRLREEGRRAEREARQQKALAAIKRSQEITSAVQRTPPDVLRERMRKYQRD